MVYWDCSFRGKGIWYLMLRLNKGSWGVGWGGEDFGGKNEKVGSGGERRISERLGKIKVRRIFR